MGLRMDIHNPSVPKASDAETSQNGVDNKERLMGLMKQKDDLESELSALASVLESHGVNMNTTLLTFDGFPRDDIDIAQIRTTRARIIHLRNDHKALMSQIEKGLHEVHASYQASPPLPATADAIPIQASASREAGASQPRTDGLPDTVFAKVNSVVSNSPAATAGLRAGDGIIRFGEVNFMNHANLGRVSTVVQMNQGKEITVRVLRTNADSGMAEPLELQLTPRSNWGGRGLLGCHLLPA